MQITKKTGIMIVAIIIAAVIVDIYIFLALFGGVGLVPSEIARNDAQGMYEFGDVVLMNGFCFDQMVGTELLIYQFTDDSTGDGVGIHVLSDIELTAGSQYTMYISYQPAHWVFTGVI